MQLTDAILPARPVPFSDPSPYSWKPVETGKLLDRFNAPTHFAVKLYKGDDLRHVMIFGSREMAEEAADKVRVDSIMRVELDSWKQ